MKVAFNKQVVQTLPVGQHQDAKCLGLTLTVTEHSRRFGVYISVKSMPTRKSIDPISDWSVEAAHIKAGEIILELRQAADKPLVQSVPTVLALSERYTRKLEIECKWDTTYIADAVRRGCKNFCVNGQLAGNCHAPRSDDDRSKESRTQGIAGQPAG